MQEAPPQSNQSVPAAVDNRGMKEKAFRRWEIDQLWLFPPSVMDFVPEDHLVHFVRETVRNDLDVSAIFAHYSTRNGQGPLRRDMRRRLRQGGWTSRYRLRKQTVEPVFGQIKECRNFRRFLHRGLDKVSAEWTMLCTAHNLLKLARARG